MRGLHVSRYFILALVMLIGGCDGAAIDERAAADLHVDLSALMMSRPQQEACAHPLDEVVLMANGREVGRQTLPENSFVVVFEEVEVEVGEVEFTAEILTNTGAPVFRGSTREEIEGDGFGIELPVEVSAGLLLVCPRSLDTTFNSTLQLRNAGNQTLAVEIVPPDADCDGEPCLGFDPQEASIAAGSLEPVQVNRAEGDLQTHTVRITSTTGYVDVDIEASVFIID